VQRDIAAAVIKSGYHGIDKTTSALAAVACSGYPLQRNAYGVA
jgi:hypothetical protein